MRILILIAVLGLSACGFYLRGSQPGIALETPIFLDDKSTGLVADQLRRTLNEQSLLATDADADTLEVQIDKEESSRQTASLGSDNRVREVELLYSVQLHTRTASQEEFESEEVQVRREYTYDATGVLGSANEEEILFEEMRSELVRRLRERLAALSRGATQ